MKQYLKKKTLLFLVILIFCISAITIPVGAHFAQVVISCTGRICAANYALNVTIDGENFTNGTMLTAGTYTVTLEKAETSTATKGFCLVEIGGKTYYTDKTEFKITIEGEAKVVSIAAHWGEATHYASGKDWLPLKELSTEPTTDSSSAEEPTTVVNSES